MKRLLFVLLAMGASAASAETIAYWRFGEKGLEDCSGHNIELVNTNVELDSTGAAVFNGINSSLETKESLDLSAYNKLTVECWIKPESPEAASTDFMPLFQHYFWDSEIRNYPGSFVTYFSGNDNGFKTFRSQLRDGAGGGGNVRGRQRLQRQGLVRPRHDGRRRAGGLPDRAAEGRADRHFALRRET